jgi:hypothetical protein
VHARLIACVRRPPQEIDVDDDGSNLTLSSSTRDGLFATLECPGGTRLRISVSGLNADVVWPSRHQRQRLRRGVVEEEEEQAILADRTAELAAAEAGPVAVAPAAVAVATETIEERVARESALQFELLIGIVGRCGEVWGGRETVSATDFRPRCARLWRLFSCKIKRSLRSVASV